MAFNLKEFRESRMKMTQEQFALFIGERQDTISRWERGNIDDIPMGKMKILAQKTGQTLDELLEYEKHAVKPLSVSATWNKAELLKQTFCSYLKDRRKDTWDFYSKTPELLTEYDNILKTDIKKLSIAFIGMSDAGKSTMINALIGANKMPVKWTPTTSITIFINHINDRPDFITEEVWIFKAESSKKTFSIETLADEKKAKTLCIAKGDVETLREYGTRQGDKYGEEAVAATVYIDSEILRNVQLIDLPGFGTGDRKADDTATSSIGNLTNAVVYLSTAIGFLNNGPENEILRAIIGHLPNFEKRGENDISPLGNLFIVASHAHTVDGGNPYSLKEILDTKCSQFEKTLPDKASKFFAVRNKETGYKCEKHLRDRFFTYSTDRCDLRSEFEEGLRDLIQKLPNHVIESAKQRLQMYAEENGDKIDVEIEGFYRLINDKEREEAELKLILDNEPNRRKDAKSKRNSIVKEIDVYCDSSLSEFSTQYSNIISVDGIVSSIESRGFKKKKEDMEALSSHISAKLEDALKTTLNSHSDKLKTSIEDYIADFQSGCSVVGKLGITATIPFDAKRVFAGGLAGVATFGGLAIWASTLGNLGAYILVAKGVSVLSALGISIAGGTAAATAAVASIGGPVVLGIALAVMAALSFFAIFSGGWKKKVAEKLVASYASENALASYRKIISNFWKNDTIKAFNIAADSMEQGWENAIKEKQALIDNYDIADIERRISICKELKSFLAEIPLQDAGLLNVE